jgi:hypothetical protein
MMMDAFSGALMNAGKIGVFLMYVRDNRYIVARAFTHKKTAPKGGFKFIEEQN